MRLAAFAALAVLPLLHTATAPAADAPCTAFVSPQGELIVTHGGNDLLKLALIAWGPKWAWTGLKEEVRSENGSAVGSFTGKLGGTNVPFRIDFRAANPEPKRLTVSYELKADAETALTLIVVELAPGSAFNGKDIQVAAGGNETAVRCPFDKRGLGKQVSAIRFTDAAGATTAIRLSPAIDIASDGPARIVLAAEKLPAGETRKLALEIDLPGAVQWYPTAAEMPAEKGADEWYTWQATSDTATESPLGMQDWLEKPAGKSGRITRQGARQSKVGRGTHIADTLILL